jgi:hypothetical protein
MFSAIDLSVATKVGGCLGNPDVAVLYSKVAQSVVARHEE